MTPCGRRRAAGAADERPRARSPARRCAAAAPGSSAAPSATRCSVARPTDLDVVVDGDVGAAARALARAARGPLFELSDEFGSWRVMAPDRAWQVDLSPLRGGSLEADLALRDFTVNAIAEPLAGGERVDPHGGARGPRGAPAARGRAAARSPTTRCASCGSCGSPPSSGSRPTPATSALARASAPRAAAVAQERVFAELKRIVAGDGVVASLRADGRPRADRGDPARAARAARRRAEPLPPRRRPRAHDRGARAGGRAAGRPRRGVRRRARRRGRARCSPSRSPRTSIAASRCASARCCTTSPSR